MSTEDKKWRAKQSRTVGGFKGKFFSCQKSFFSQKVFSVFVPVLSPVGRGGVFLQVNNGLQRGAIMQKPALTTASAEHSFTRCTAWQMVDSGRAADTPIWVIFNLQFLAQGLLHNKYCNHLFILGTHICLRNLETASQWFLGVGIG